ncbi:MAG TPA: glycosyltransferase family 4 protein [Steroidobacteraceae bacterium]|nr:glycosyltransferase family 4 protein [Steroidobacteraceae bacterium]
MKICLVGLDSLPVLSPAFRQYTAGGESVQQTLLARALVRRGHEVSLVVHDYGQPDDLRCDGVRVLKAYRPEAGWPIARFLHPRWTGLWSALRRAAADLYYTSCAGMHVGMLAMYCKRHGSRFVFRSASDADCDPSRLLVRFARDRWLYDYGLRRANAILVQSMVQAASLKRSFGLASRVAAMLIEQPAPTVNRDIDLIWVANIRNVKRPDRILALARQCPDMRIHLVGGPLPGEEALFESVQRDVQALSNVICHGRVSYSDANDLYGRARLLINTSDVEGFPNSFLQAWIRGVPVVTLFDPDGVIGTHGLGVTVAHFDGMHDAVRTLLADSAQWSATSDRCRRFMDRYYRDDDVVTAYVDTFERVLRDGAIEPDAPIPAEAGHG